MPRALSPVRLVAGGLVLAWLAIATSAAIDWPLVERLFWLPLVGVLGATIANTSGTGGGVVFVPVFTALREAGTLSLAPLQVTAASFAIQCFGMTMGAARWTTRLIEDPAPPIPPRDFAVVCGCVLAVSLPVMLATQRWSTADPHAVLLAFKLFSLALGLALLVTSWTVNRALPERRTLARVDLGVLLLLGALGGFATAFFSVGVGELVALYLFIRHYPILLATGAACVVSAVSVVAGVVWHIQAGTVPWEVVLLAGPGAMAGGWLARPVALWLGALRLKTIDGLWIVGSSLYLLALNWR